MSDALENAREAVERDPVSLWLSSDERRAWQAVHKAIRLATTLEVMEALLRDEPVPISKLDPDWAKAYGLL